jgi:cyclase
LKKEVIRIIPKLDIKNGLLIKGINLEGLRILGDPFQFAKHYYSCGADEIIYLDNVATLYGTNNLSNFVSRTSKNSFIPLTVGGGIRSIRDIKEMFKSGADKVCLNSQLIKNPKFVKKCIKIFGSSNTVAIVEAIKINNSYFISYSNGRDLVKIDPLKWSKFLENEGVGELIITCVNKEGLMEGFDISLIKKISNSLKIPVLAHGGAGNFQHVYDVIKKTNIAGVVLSSLLHYQTASFLKKKFKKKIVGNTHFLENLKQSNSFTNIIKKLKKFLNKKGINVRL